jgi:uridine kinase
MGPRLVGIAGPSCSGKTELAQWLKRRTGAPVLNLDVYYIDLSHLPLEERARRNFDEPAALDRGLILEHARALAAGRAVRAPHYDFATHARAPGDELIEPGELVILEGLFTLYWPELRDLLHVKLYVDAPDEVCFARRLERDVRERGRTPESVRWQFETTVRPMAHLHILPEREHADLILSGIDPIDQSGERALALIG